MKRIETQISYKDITPEALRCPPPACPAIYEASDGTLLIVGRLVKTDSLPSELHSRIGKDEQAVVVPKGFLNAKINLS